MLAEYQLNEMPYTMNYKSIKELRIRDWASLLPLCLFRAGSFKDRANSRQLGLGLKPLFKYYA